MTRPATAPAPEHTPPSLPERVMPAVHPCGIFLEKPASLSTPAPGVLLIDFGRVAFGNLEFAPPAGVTGKIVVHFGEAFANGRIDRQPPGSVRYQSTTVTLDGDALPSPPLPLVIETSADERNTNELAVLLPPEWGIVLPFRWVEIEGWPADAAPPVVRRRSIYTKTWDDSAAAFASSNPLLDRIWELCRYTIKATTFAGVYVDGDRERRPYEADTYLNQLSHYACDHDFSMPRDTFDYLMQRPTRSTEWAPHMVFVAHADWRHTGDTTWVAARYESLKTKLLLERARPDGLIASNPDQIKNDIVDWPPGERDGYVFTPVNTVVNAFHLRALALMSELARALGKTADADAFDARARTTGAAFQRHLFDPARGLYRDGEGTDHASLHANLFPLAFGLAPAQHRDALVAFLTGKGMACSVYAAQYLLETLFENDADETAFALITADGDRSWKHMIESGATLTWEAWDQHYKPNQDWNHAWGAAPANLLPRYVVGVQSDAPGWKRIRIRPHTGPLASCSGKIPTPLGSVEVEWRKDAAAFTLTFSLPPGTSARLELPAIGNNSVQIDGRSVEATRHGRRLHIIGEWSGHHRVEVR
ncbi:alpha-L-rhamnosidase C-terminal domain-containing protein [Geminisphaera colitermitum]|uniref:alpha-L-rhamnosidase-related protein n=1 Tax=Geminisphaera colitermitum TaxID=1148786 RepID=UPI000158D543|nr:alpha-L-rhamnosidase C-terminal domain-containing protein [Geminisphaera colitermitum]